MKMNKKADFLVLLLFMLSSTLFSTAQAVPTACGTSGSLFTDDVTLAGVDSVDCGGVYSGNNSQVDINTHNSGELLFSGSNWGAEIKDDTPGAAGSGTGGFLGLDWTLSAGAGTSNSWTLSIADPGPVSLPVTVDLLVVLKASTKWAAYLIENQTFTTPGNTNGTYQIAFTNNGGKIPNLSHMSLYLRPSAVPVPAAVWLFASAVFGLVGFRRK